MSDNKGKGKKNPLKLGNFRADNNATPLQAETDKVVKEVLTDACVEMYTDLFLEFKIALLRAKMEMTPFFDRVVDEVLKGYDPSLIKKYKLDRDKEIYKKAFKISLSKKDDFKMWLLKNKLSQREVMTHFIAEFIKKQKM